MRSSMRPLIVLFGNSLTEEAFIEGGWGAHLANHFSRTADIVLRGYSGYNTRWARKILNQIMEEMSRPPAAVIVFLGTNDAALSDRSCGYQHVPISEFKDNIQSICTSIKEKWPSTNIILVTPSPIDEDGRIKHRTGDWELPERTNNMTGDFAKACVDVARETGVPIIDMWSEVQHIPDWEKSLLRDGMHFTSQGHRLLFEEVVKALKKCGLSLEKLPSDMPLFSEIEPDNPMKSFTDM